MEKVKQKIVNTITSFLIKVGPCERSDERDFLTLVCGYCLLGEKAEAESLR